MIPCYSEFRAYALIRQYLYIYSPKFKDGELLLEFHVLCNHQTKARFKRRTLHVPNLMQMRKIYCFRSFALDSAYVKFDA